MTCEFKNTNLNSLKIACKRSHALKQVSRELEGVMSPNELMQELCNNPDIKGKTQCFAFHDLSEHKTESDWTK